MKKIEIKGLSVIILPYPLKKEFPDNLNINDPFFDYFKDKYPFEKWFHKCLLARRECWVYYESETNIGALLIPKIEDDSVDSVPPLSKKKRIKICTFKVKSTGNRIGELFIKCATRLALEENASEIYLTHFTEENDRLIELISEYGFDKVATLERENGKEDLYLKIMRLEGQNIGKLQSVEIAKKFYPCFDDRKTIKKFIIPIRPEYHKRLFNDYDSSPFTVKEGYQMRLQEYIEGGMDTSPIIIEGNTIKKAYLCHSNSKKIRSGDIVLFYRSKDFKSITALGVVESIKVGLNNFEEIYNLVRKRTAFDKERIKSIAEKPTTVILFTHQTYFSKGLDIKYLRSIGITSPMSINEIDHDKYKKIKEYGKLDGRLTIY